MSRTPGEVGELAPPLQSGVGSLDKNGFGAGAPPRRPETARRPSPFRALLLPVLAAAVCGGGAFVVSSRYMTHWYSTAETIWFPATGNQGAGGILQSLIVGGAADSTGSVPILNGLYNSPQFGSGPNTAITALDSGRVKGEVLNELHLAARWHLSPQQAAERFNKNVSYGVDKDGLLDVQATDTDPQMARQIVTTYVTAMRDVSTQLSIAIAHRNLTVVRQRYAAAHDKLLRQESELVALQTHTAQAMPLGGAAASAYVDLMSQKTAAQTALNGTNAEIEAQLRTAQKTYGRSLALPTSVPFANNTIDELRKAEADFTRVSAIYGPEYPGYREAQDRVAQARAQASAELKRQLSAVTQYVSPEMSALYIKRATEQAQLDSLSVAASARKADMLSLPAAQMREDDLKRQISLSNTLDTTLAQAVAQAELAEKRDVPTYEIVDAAGVPDTPALPRVPLMTALATVAGFLLAVAFQVGRTVVRQTSGFTDFSGWAQRYSVGEPLDVAPRPALDVAPQAALMENTRQAIGTAHAETGAELATPESLIGREPRV